MKTTKQLAREIDSYTYSAGRYILTLEALEDFRRLCIKDYFESAEPVAYLFADRTMMLADVPGANKVATKLNSKLLYTAPKE